MTSEQFIFWLSGYFTGGRENDDDAVVRDIREALKHVEINLHTVLYMGGCEE